MISRGGAIAAAGTTLCLSLAPAVGTTQLAISGAALASFYEHQVDIGYGVEESHGLVLGAEGALDVQSRLELRMHAAGGSLSPASAGVQNRDVGEVGIEGRLLAARWLALLGGVTSRTYSTVLARQRWTMVELGAEARVEFATSPVRSVLRVGLLPLVAVHGLPGPDVALTAATGVEYLGGLVTGGLFYGLERFDFPDRGAGRRLEQVSTLTFRFVVHRRGRTTWP